MPDQTPQIVLAHDSLTQYGGAERVLHQLVRLFPDAPVYTLVRDHQKMDQHIRGWRVVTSPLQYLYNVIPNFQYLFPVIPLTLALWWPARGAKVLLSSSSSFIKGILKPPGSVHIDYCHTPTRFLHIDPEHAYQEIPKLLIWPAKFIMYFMRKWDLYVASKVDVFIANSYEVQRRIREVYHRDSVVVQPSINTHFWTSNDDATGKSTTPYFLIAGRLQYGKGLAAVVEACNELGTELHVVGQGRYENHLRKIAGPTVHFLGRASDAELRDQYRHAQAYIYPQLEDFGIMPLEAAACGLPTIGLAAGGSLETIIPGVTGELYSKEQLQKDGLKDILANWDKTKYRPEAMRAHAELFSEENFNRKILAIVNVQLNQQVQQE